MTHKRLAVYTAIIGGYDDYKEPPEGDYDSYVFTDADLKSRSATVLRPALAENLDPCRRARAIKILSHLCLPQYEFTIWVDGSVQILRNDLLPFVEGLLARHDLAVFRHRLRSRLEHEAEVVANYGIDDAAVVHRQIEQYRNEGYVSDDLAETGVLVRRTKKCVVFESLWWEEVKNGSKRDQLSFGYAVWKTGLRRAWIPGIVWWNEWFRVLGHAQRSR